VNGSCQNIDERRVLSFTLVDAYADSDIGVLHNGDIIDLSVTPNISVRADVCPGSDIESVKFLLNGSLFRTENILPYMIAGDNNGNYTRWNVQPGVYTIRAIPYSGNNATGIAGIYKEITITVIDGPVFCLEDIMEVSSFTLINSATDAVIGPLVDGAVIDLSVTGPINVRANVCNENNIESVIFKLNGRRYRIENYSPYALAGDNPARNYHTWNVQPGVYTILATPFSNNNGSGTAGTPLSITITIISTSTVAKMNDGEDITNEPAEDETILKAYPNPFADILTIEFSLPEDSRAKLEIFNLTGQRIAELFEGDVKAFEIKKVEFAPEKVSSGILVYRLQTEKGTFFGKAVIAR